MNKVLMEQFPLNNVEINEVLSNATLDFEKNPIGDDTDGCPRYGCTCIAYEKCCGCLLQ